MSDVQEIQISLSGAQEPVNPIEDATPIAHTSPPFSWRRWQWWLMVAINIFFVLAGETVATLLGRLYYNNGGNTKWMVTLVQTVGFPILFLPFFLYPSPHTPPTTSVHRPPAVKIALIYITFGLIAVGNDLMSSYGLSYLPVSTFSVVSASQLAFNVVLSYFLNSQKFTPLIFNSVVLLTFSAALLGLQSDSKDSTHIPKGKYPLGFILTLGASAGSALLVCLLQLIFQKVLKGANFLIVLELQICVSFVASCAAVVGLFASGEWRSLKGEMEAYEKGTVSYVMTLAWVAICGQLSSVGSLGLIFMVSSLFSNVIGTLALPTVPVFAVIFFHDKMDGVKVVALLIATWGFVSYIYQNYIDDRKAKKASSDDEEVNGLSIS